MRPSERLGRPLPEALESLVLAALAKTADERPESASAFADALSRCAGVPPWTEAEAAGWWREAGARIKAARSGAEPPRAAAALTIERLPAAAQEEIPGGG